MHLPRSAILVSILMVSLVAAVVLQCRPDAVVTTFERDESWFPFEPAGDHDAASVIGMQDWLDAPAGKHGRVVRDGDQLIYNGEPIKLWGTNLCYASGTAPTHEIAEQRAAMYAKFGINSVRLHKYLDGPDWAGIVAEATSLEFDQGKLDRFDYQIAEFKKRGIFIKLSPSFGSPQLGPADRDRVPYMDEFGGMEGNSRVRVGHGAIYASTELQDLQIQGMVNVLEHRNPYTQMTYSEDPALAVIEIVNEESALFGGMMSVLEKVPTLRRMASEKFSDWLLDRYGSERGLLDAWGPRALDSFSDMGFAGESLGSRSIVPLGNPWFYDPEQLDGAMRHRKQRLLDTMLFWYQQQNAFYDRFVEAVRAAGYEGEILASNWQAGRDFSHYYNLHSDYRIGLIDRHNYTGGVRSDGVVRNASNLHSPGAGLLGTGMQQVADRPFMVSEWIHVNPNEWSVEGPAIIGAYGMGLQGWDVSYIFDSTNLGRYDDEIDLDRRPWQLTKPTTLGVFPAVARQVHRGDVKEARVVATRSVHVPSLDQAMLDFSDSVEQEFDIKTFTSDKAPVETLAIGRSVVEFTDGPRPTPPFDVARHRKGSVYESVTGQLRWKPGAAAQGGFITIDTPGTQGVVGFARGEAIELGQVAIKSQSPFAAIYVTALDRDGDIATSQHLLITTLARAHNTGMKVVDDRLVDAGHGPILMEPVLADIRIERPGTPTVVALDHDGRLTDRVVPSSNGAFKVDGARYQTIYYRVSY